MKLALFNVKYSRNLGDGVIAECLEHELARQTGATVRSLDLAGRTEWEQGAGDRARSLKLAALHAMPRRLSDLAVATLLGRELSMRIVPLWEEQLAGVDGAIVGGGQLIQDGDLNFPLKLAAAIALCEARALPVAVFAVGAAPSRSPRGQALFARLFGSPQLAYVAARDEASCRELGHYGVAAALCRDPGLLAAALWPSLPRAVRSRPRIGLGVTHPAVLAHHGTAPQRGGLANAVALYLALVERLAGAGYEVQLFSNGATEDESLLAILGQRLADHPAAAVIGCAPRAATPAQLAAIIDGCDAVIAHRLHACILAYAYRRPAIGLRWDAKLDAVFASLPDAGQVLAFAPGVADEAVRLLPELLGRGIDGERHQHIMAETRAGITQAVEAFAPGQSAAARNVA